MSQLLMLRHKVLSSLPEIVLPEGYSIRTHRDGDEAAWCEICESLNRGVKPPEHFDAAMKHDKTILPQRIFYVTDPDGIPVATATMRIRSPKLGTLHMVETRPSARGKGLGKAVCTAAVASLDAMNIPDCDLTTDDFRIPAIKIYLSLGFRPVYHEPDMEGRWNAIFEILNSQSKQ